MDALPNELVAEIVSYVQGRIGHLATISRAWQKCVERLTFAHLLLTQDRFDQATKFITTTRIEYIKSLELRVILDEYDDSACCIEETEAERVRNSKLFTKTVSSLFSLLERVERHIDLVIDVYSPSDVGYCLFEKYEERSKNPADLLERRYRNSLIVFDGTEKMPDIRCVQSLQLMSLKDHVRPLCPKSACAIASKMVRLDKLSMRLKDVGNESERLYRRGDLAAGIAKFPPSLRVFDLAFGNHGGSHTLEETQDPLSLALHRLCLGLEEMCIFGFTLGDEFFWPATDTMPCWPRLKELIIYMEAITPSGKHHLAQDSSTQQKVAMALQQMPNLSSMELKILRSEGDYAYEYDNKSQRFLRKVTAW